MYTTGHLKRQMCGVWDQGCSGGAVFSYGPWALIDVLFWFSESLTRMYVMLGLMGHAWRIGM